MARTRDGFVPIGDRGLTHRAAAPQARHHCTPLDSVTQLVGAS